MHYEEMAEAIEDHVDWTELTHEQGMAFVQLKNALRDGQGYVAIILDPDGLKIVPCSVEGNSQATIRAKQDLRRVVRDVQRFSGTPNPIRSRTTDQG